MGIFPASMPYQEETLTLLASSKPHFLAGLWNYVEVLNTGDSTDTQEVSFNQGQTWTRLRKGLIVPIGDRLSNGEYAGTTGLAFRNPTAADVVVSLAVGFGSLVDARLLIDSSQGAVTVINQYTMRTPAAAGAGYSAGNQAADAGTVLDLVTAVQNANGIRIHAGAYFFCSGAPAIASLYLITGASISRIAGVATNVAGQVAQHCTPTDIIAPPGYKMQRTTQGISSWEFNYTIL